MANPDQGGLTPDPKAGSIPVRNDGSSGVVVGLILAVAVIVALVAVFG
jgi:hypothetical protein